MADRYPLQLVGVADGTTVPAGKADGRQVGAKERTYLYSKVPGVEWATSDRFYLGKKPQGEKIVDILVNTDTSFSTTTLDIGDGTTVDKYVDGKTNTVTNSWVSIGPKAATLDDGVPDEEDIWLTVLTTAIASATVCSFRIVTSGL